MITQFFLGANMHVFAVLTEQKFTEEDLTKLSWLFEEASPVQTDTIEGTYIGPRKEMITPWSTNAVEITQNMGIMGILRIEQFTASAGENPKFDPMLQFVYHNLDQQLFKIDVEPAPIELVEDITAYNKQEGLALNADEVEYLNSLSKKLGRKLTDSEIFGFSQVNSEHCRHKIFNGKFIIDGQEQEKSLFKLIRLTTETNLNKVVSAYKDNCAFITGPKILQFAPVTHNKPDVFKLKEISSVLTIKAETHNFPTTVEPFNGAATGSGGEIRDRLAGGTAAVPMAGTAVYMTSYPRTDKRQWEEAIPERNWLYQTPEQILVKASNGASDFGNKFGQPLICGSLFTFEHTENDKKFGYDKVIMMAGGIGYGKEQDTLKKTPEKGDKVILMGGDNYRIGMGGGAVSSVETGEYDNAIELNAVQRSNPEMQKRVANAIRAMSETDENPIVSIHDHGAGGHLNCLSELVEDTGGIIDISKLPVGDPTLSDKEIVGNESQERMGLVLKKKDINTLKEIAERERAPFYEIGDVTGDQVFTFNNPKNNTKPINLDLADMFGNPPQTVMDDKTTSESFKEIEVTNDKVYQYIESVLQLEAVACKDWLTNKVDRSVTGRVAKQQTAGEIQLPLNNVAVMALNYHGGSGFATSVGHAPAIALIDPEAGSVMAITESLTNIIWAPLQHGLEGISLSANWMWPCKNEGEDARLYKAVKAASDFSLALGINIPTGKDSLSMTQKYPDGEKVFSPGTVIISAAAEVDEITRVVEPVLKQDTDSKILYIDLSKQAFALGGSSLAQTLNLLGNTPPTVRDAEYLKTVFNTIQGLIKQGEILAGHDVSSGGLLTTLLEMTFANNSGGIDISLDGFNHNNLSELLFSENPALVIQVAKNSNAYEVLANANITYVELGSPATERQATVMHAGKLYRFDIDALRDTWFKSSYLLDRKQAGEHLAKERFNNYKYQPLQYSFPSNFEGSFKSYGIDPVHNSTGIAKAAIIREKGVNGDREMAYALHLAGFEVYDVHMTDLITGRETLEDKQMIVFVGGFSNSDVLGSAKGWAGAFLYNPKAKKALDNFYSRPDTLSLGVCNGCQLMIELGLIESNKAIKPKMSFNESHKFESIFLNVSVPKNNSVLLSSLAGSRLGIWVAHGEGKFNLAADEAQYNVPLKYSYEQYPGNPNGSDFNIAGLNSKDGRHLAMMPHLERSIFPWNWAYYHENRNDEVSPWIEAFTNAKNWIEKQLLA